MKIANSRGLLILVSFSLIISIFVPMGMIGDVQASGPTYTTHSAIHINNNNDLLTLRASNVSTGSGTVNDPYVINGYDISGTGGTSIYVGNITWRLVISNNFLQGYDYGIVVQNSPHVLITNNNCSDNDRYSIWLRSTGNATVTNNVCIAGAHAIYTSAAYDNIINNNTCRATRACAIMLAGDSNRNVLSNNTCYSSGDNGIYVLHSHHNTLSNNKLKNNIGHGIHLASSDYNTVYGSEMIRNNGSTSIYNASHIQCNDTGVGNQWNTASYGNYWSDWTTPDANLDGIVDNPYLIDGGNSKDHYPLVATPRTAVPGVPTDLTATAGNGQVGLTWNAPRSNGGAAVDHYIVYQDNLECANVSSTSATITGLTNGNNYSFKVAAHNAAGLGAPSVGISSIPYGVSIAPTGLAVLPGNAQAVLNWTAPSLNGGAAIDYYIVYQDNADARHVTSTSTTIVNLTNGRSYSFAVAAHNSAGIGARCSPVSATPFTFPGTPSGLGATPGNAQVTLSWTAPASDGGATIDYYVVYQDGVPRADHYTMVSPTVTGLTNGQSYGFTVAAHNSAGTGPQTSVVSATPDPVLTVPGIPNGLTVNPGNAQASLSWTAPASDGGAAIDYYIVYQDGADVQHLAGTSVTITGLTNGHIYGFTVAAHNSIGNSTQSSAVTATPSPAPVVPGVPTEISTTPGNAEVSISWAVPTSNGGASIDYYIVYQDGLDVAHPSINSTTIAGLTNGRSYTFALAAHNSAGTGPRTSGVSVSPNPVPTVPGIPAGLTFTSGNAQISLSWIAPSSNGGAAIDYYIVYQDGIEISHTTTTSKTITGLTNGASNNYTVAAHNSVGIGVQTSAITATPSLSATAPGTPTNLTNKVGDGIARLSWNTPSNSGSSAIDYYIVYQDGVDVGHPSVNSTTITGLTNGLNYSFTVSAHNSGGVGAPSPSLVVSPSVGPNSGATTSPGSDSIVMFAGIIALLSVATIAVVLVLRRKQNK